jgi:hypothetical protein
MGCGDVIGENPRIFLSWDLVEAVTGHQGGQPEEPDMSINPMRETQQSLSSVWRLAACRSMRIVARPQGRRLRVLQGAVWLTLDATLQMPSTDVWLVPGDEWVVPAGARAVLEGWPQASVEVTDVAPARSGVGAAVAALGRLVASVLQGRSTEALWPARPARSMHADSDWGGLYNAGVPRGL